MEKKLLKQSRRKTKKKFQNLRYKNQKMKKNNMNKKVHKTTPAEIKSKKQKKNRI